MDVIQMLRRECPTAALVQTLARVDGAKAENTYLSSSRTDSATSTTSNIYLVKLRRP